MSLSFLQFGKGERCRHCSDCSAQKVIKPFAMIVETKSPKVEFQIDFGLLHIISTTFLGRFVLVSKTVQD